MGFHFKDGCIVCEILLDFDLCASILVTFSLGGGLGQSPESGQLTNLGGWARVTGFKGSGVGDVIQNQTSPDYRLPEVGITVHLK